MRFRSVIKLACSLLLLLGTLGSYGSSLDRGHRSHEIGRSSMIDAGGIISTAFSILEDAAMSESLTSVSGGAHLLRSVSDFTAAPYSRIDHHPNVQLVYFCSDQHAMLPPCVPLFLSTRRLLI